MQPRQIPYNIGMSRPAIYLDCNATSPLDPRVAAVLNQAFGAAWGNPASQHRAGQQARRALERAREEMTELLGADCSSRQADRLVLTSGATEANNLALFGLAGSRPGTIIISSVEHPSIAGPAAALERSGCKVHRLRVSAEGVIDLDHLRELLSPEVRLVSVILGNNETGVIQPLAAAAALCASAGVPLHTDAVQAVGKIPVDFRRLGVAALTFNGHKLHGPRGMGGLLIRADVSLDPLLFGGFQQGGLRPGTESVELALGLCSALRLAQEELEARRRHMQQLRDRLENRLREGWPELVVLGAGARRLPHTSQVAFPGLDRQALVLALDLAGVVCSTGSACASGSTDPSPTLLAMGCQRGVVEGAVRFSLGAFHEAAEVDEAARRILAVVNDLRDHSGGRNLPAAARSAGHDSL